MLKKLLSTVIVLLMTFNVCYAEELRVLDEKIVALDAQTGGIVLKEIETEENEFFVQSFLTSNLSAEEYIRQQLYNRTEIIDLSAYGITLGELSMILATNKDFIVASGYMDYACVDDKVAAKDRIVIAYKPRYLLSTKAEDAAARRFINESIKRYADEIKSQTDDLLGRLLLLHDNLIEDCEYDDDYKVGSYSLYSVFANKEMVCQGYAQAMYFIGRELGLDIEFCSSFEIGHIWNYVKIGNECYHMDSTWNDPVLIDSNNNRVHRTTASHRNFLMSDATMQSGDIDHGSKNDWITSLDEIPVCNSRFFEENHFFNISSAFTTSVNNGKYEASIHIQTYTGTQENKVFYADRLYTGPIITSYPEENNDSYFVYCFVISNINEFNLYVKAQKSEKVVDVIKFEKAAYAKNTLTGQQILKSQLPIENDDISIYMWDSETMKPLSRVIPIS